MLRTKMTEVEPAQKTAVNVTEKIIEIDDEPGVAIVPGLEPEDEDAEEEEALDTEEVDPFGDTWEQ